MPVGKPSRRQEEGNLVTELDGNPGRNRQVSASIWGQQELHGSTTPKFRENSLNPLSPNQDFRAAVI